MAQPPQEDDKTVSLPEGVKCSLTPSQREQQVSSAEHGRLKNILVVRRRTGWTKEVMAVLTNAGGCSGSGTMIQSWVPTKELGKPTMDADVHVAAIS